MHGISNAIGETDLIAAQKMIMGEVSQVSQDMTQFIMGSDRGILAGYEVSGRIDAAGTGADTSWIGRDVLAMTRFGGYADVEKV